MNLSVQESARRKSFSHRFPKQVGHPFKATGTAPLPSSGPLTPSGPKRRTSTLLPPVCLFSWNEGANQVHLAALISELGFGSIPEKGPDL